MSKRVSRGQHVRKDWGIHGGIERNGREEDRGRERKGEKDTRSPFMVAILPRGSGHVARLREGQRGGVKGETKSQWVSPTGMVSLPSFKGVVDRPRVAIPLSLSLAHKTYQNPVRPI